MRGTVGRVLRALLTATLLAVALIASFVAVAEAARPISRGHYELQTPDVCDTPFVGPSDACTFGKGFPTHVFRRVDRFSPYSFVEVIADCPARLGYYEHWRFYLSETPRLHPVRITADGSFNDRRPGALAAYGGPVHRPAPHKDRATLTISGAFTTRTRGEGTLKVHTKFGCSASMPFRLVYRRTSWQTLIDRL